MKNFVDFNRINLDTFEDNLKLLFKTETLINNFKENVSIYTKILENKNIAKLLNSQEMIDTINILFEKNLNLSMASKSAFMHRNTLIYRVNKIEKLTGLNIKTFDDAVILKNIIMIYNFLFKN